MMGRGLRVITVVVIAVIVLAIGASIIGSVTVDEGEYRQAIEQAKAYCYQAYGDPGVYNAQVIGNHGGLHCEANDDDPHLHVVTERAKLKAYFANESNQTVDQWPKNRYEPPHERGWKPTLLTAGSVAGFGLLIAGALKYAPGMAGGRR